MFTYFIDSSDLRDFLLNLPANGKFNLHEEACLIARRISNDRGAVIFEAVMHYDFPEIDGLYLFDSSATRFSIVKTGDHFVATTFNDTLSPFLETSAYFTEFGVTKQSIKNTQRAAQSKMKLESQGQQSFLTPISKAA